MALKNVFCTLAFAWFATSANAQNYHYAQAVNAWIESDGRIRVSDSANTFVETPNDFAENLKKVLLMKQEIEAAKNTQSPVQIFTRQDGRKLYLWLSSGQITVGIKPSDVKISHDPIDGRMLHFSVSDSWAYAETHPTQEAANSRHLYFAKKLDAAHAENRSVRFSFEDGQSFVQLRIAGPLPMTLSTRQIDRNFISLKERLTLCEQEKAYYLRKLAVAEDDRDERAMLGLRRQIDKLIERRDLIRQEISRLR